MTLVAALLACGLSAPARAAIQEVPLVTLPASPRLSAVALAAPSLASPSLPVSAAPSLAPGPAAAPFPAAAAPALTPTAAGLPASAAPAADGPSPLAQAEGRPAAAAAPAPAPRPGESRESWSSRWWSRLLGESSKETYQNPVFAGNVPDPGAARDGKTYYVAGTSNGGQDSFPLLKSSNLRDWTHAGFLFPRGARPAWAHGFFWAPEIHRVGKRWAAYYTAQNAAGRLSLGVATADRVEGPWTDLGRPLLEQEGMGLIDAHRFEDQDGRHYMYWKEDANDLKPKQRTGLFVQELAPDGLSLIGKPARLLENDLDWEGDLIEAPWVERRGKYYYLFYSANNFATDRYAVGVARATSPRGPFEKLGRPILRSNATWIGPGHNSVVRWANWADRARGAIARAFPNGSRARRLLAPLVGALARAGGRDWIVYHAWEAGRVGGFSQTFLAPFPKGENPRMLMIDRLRYENGWPRVEDGTPSVSARPLRQP